jgi:hypothetical protein
MGKLGLLRYTITTPLLRENLLKVYSITYTRFFNYLVS